MLYQPRHSATRIRRINRSITRKKRWMEALVEIGLGVLGGTMLGALVGLMFII